MLLKMLQNVKKNLITVSMKILSRKTIFNIDDDKNFFLSTKSAY